MKLNKDSIKKVSPWFWLALVALIATIIIILQQRKLSRTELQRDNFSKAIDDVLSVVRLKDSSQLATISAFQSESLNDFLELKTKDSTILRLQTLVSNYSKKLGSGTAATFSTTSKVTIKSGGTTILSGKTVIQNDTVFVYPTYVTIHHLDKWINGTSTATKDSTILDLNIYDEYDVVVGETKGGLFKKKEVFADVITHSPYNSVSTLRAYKVSVPKQKKLGLGASAGWGLNSVGRTMIYVGVGVNYNFIQIR